MPDRLQRRRREDGTGRERGEQAIGKTARRRDRHPVHRGRPQLGQGRTRDPRRALFAYSGNPGVGDNTAAAGWDGRGRQRVDLVLPPEQVRRLATGEIVVSLTARVVTYIRTAAIWSDPTVTAAAAMPARSRVRPCAGRGPVSRHARMVRRTAILG